jgi:hypothetical protein
MATKYINCQLVLAVGSQAIQRLNFISTNINCQLVFAVGSQAIQRFNFISTNISCQLALTVGSQAIQRFNFISTNFQPSTDNVNWFCCNTDNSTLVLHCISKYMKST